MLEMYRDRVLAGRLYSGLMQLQRMGRVAIHQEGVKLYAGIDGAIKDWIEHAGLKQLLKLRVVSSGFYSDEPWRLSGER